MWPLCTQISPKCESPHWPFVSGFAIITLTPGKSFPLSIRQRLCGLPLSTRLTWKKKLSSKLGSRYTWHVSCHLSIGHCPLTSQTVIYQVTGSKQSDVHLKLYRKGFIYLEEILHLLYSEIQINENSKIRQYKNSKNSKIWKIEHAKIRKYQKTKDS